MPADHDHAAIIATAEALADAARAATLAHFRADGLSADNKEQHRFDPVTVADRESEMRMREILARLRPDDAIFGEEFGATTGTSGLTWVLDPIDGTRAFITGRPLFGTLVALLEEGVPVLGVIDQPITGERWVGVAGERTRFRGPAGRAGTRCCASLDVAELSSTSPEMLGRALPRFQRLAARARRVTWGGDCYAYGLLALGQIDIVAECDLKPWDWAALGPVIEGAGGMLRDWSGRPLAADSPGDVLALGDARLLDAAIACLAG